MMTNDAYLTGQAGMLTPEIIRKALDQLYRGLPYRPDPWEEAVIRENEAVAGAIPQPDPEWAVTAAGWRLVIYDGAILGIEEHCAALDG